MLSWWLNEIAIIGTGNIGGTLARKLSAAGRDLRIANSRVWEGVRAFVNEIEAAAADTVELSMARSLLSRRSHSQR
jgi:predicted dinucleotide-binding enzyme